MVKRIPLTLPPIPWSMDNFPQQRINAVRNLPPKPKHLYFKSVYLKPHNARSIKRKRLLKYLGGVEWSWTPAHQRIDHYYLASSKKYWMLWNHILIYITDPWRWEWHLLSICKRTYNIDTKTIAIHLLKTQWEYDYKEKEVDHYHFVSVTDYFDVEDFQAIGRAVWK